MSLPSPVNDYAAPAGATLNKAFWDAALTSIGARLRAREALEATFQNLINAGVGQAIAAVQNEIGPYAASAQSDAAAIAAILSDLASQGIPVNMIFTSPAARFTSDAEMASKGSAADVAALLAAVALLAPKASPIFTGTPAAPTAALGTNTTQIATTAYVLAAIAALVNSAPSTLDTLNEIAVALGNDPNFATTILTALGYRLRFDAAQALTAPQKAQAGANLGLGTLAWVDQVTAAQAHIGAWVPLAELVANNSPTLENAALFSATYDEYEIVFEEIVPANDGVSFLMRLYSGGAYQASNYSANDIVQTTAGVAGNSSTTDIHISGVANDLPNDAGYSLNGKVWLNKPSGTTRYKAVYGQTVQASNGNSLTVSQSIVSGMWVGGLGAVLGAQWRMSAGSIASGKIRINGRKK